MIWIFVQKFECYISVFAYRLHKFIIAKWHVPIFAQNEMFEVSINIDEIIIAATVRYVFVTTAFKHINNIVKHIPPI